MLIHVHGPGQEVHVFFACTAAQKLPCKQRNVIASRAANSGPGLLGSDLIVCLLVCLNDISIKGTRQTPTRGCKHQAGTANNALIMNCTN